MGLNANGFELALDQLTDATNGINKIKLDLASGTAPAAVSITWDAAVGNTGVGTVEAANVPITISLAGGDYVQGIDLFHDTTIVANISVTDVDDANAFDYVIDSVVITMT